jgi:hypothetical protein
LALWCSAGLVLAQESKPAPRDLGRNAALTYWRAFALSPDITNEELNIISPRPGTEPKSTPEQRADLVKRWGRALELMYEAAAIPQCDWGVDYEKEGWGAALPQLAKARALARAAAFRARYFWEEGKRKDAVEDLRATVILARQTGNDGRDTVIGTLMEIAVEGIVQKTTALLLTDRESADMVANGLGDFVNGSAAHLSRNAMLAEKNAFLPWLRHEYSLDPARALKEIATDNAPAGLSQLAPKEVLQSLDELEKQYDELAALEGLTFQEFLAKRSALEEKIAASKNPFAEMVVSGLTHVREEEEKYRVQWAMVRAAIEIRREGEAALDKVLNPADGKPFIYTALEGGAFELKSALLIRTRVVAMTFGRPPAGKE